MYMMLKHSMVLSVITSRTSIDRKGRKYNDQTQGTPSEKNECCPGTCLTREATRWGESEQPAVGEGPGWGWSPSAKAAMSFMMRGWGTLPSLV